MMIIIYYVLYVMPVYIHNWSWTDEKMFKRTKDDWTIIILLYVSKAVYEAKIRN